MAAVSRRNACSAFVRPKGRTICSLTVRLFQSINPCWLSSCVFDLLVLMLLCCYVWSANIMQWSCFTASQGVLVPQWSSAGARVLGRDRRIWWRWTSWGKTSWTLVNWAFFWLVVYSMTICYFYWLCDQFVLLSKRILKAWPFMYCLPRVFEPYNTRLQVFWTPLKSLI